MASSPGRCTYACILLPYDMQVSSSSYMTCIHSGLLDIALHFPTFSHLLIVQSWVLTFDDALACHRHVIHVATASAHDGVYQTRPHILSEILKR